MARRRRYVPQRSSYQRSTTGKCPKCDFYGSIKIKKVQDDIEFICSNCGHSWAP
ncbi:MAG: YnfU family zinc-binding protein [Nitrososphaerales archaeon]